MRSPGRDEVFSPIPNQYRQKFKVNPFSSSADEPLFNWMSTNLSISTSDPSADMLKAEVESHSFCRPCYFEDSSIWSFHHQDQLSTTAQGTKAQGSSEAHALEKPSCKSRSRDTEPAHCRSLMSTVPFTAPYCNNSSPHLEPQTKGRSVQNFSRPRNETQDIRVRSRASSKDVQETQHAEAEIGQWSASSEMFCEASSNIYLVGPCFHGHATPSSFFIPRYFTYAAYEQYRGSAYDGQPTIRHLDVCETWRGLPFLAAESMFSWETAFKETIKDVITSDNRKCVPGFDSAEHTMSQALPSWNCLRLREIDILVDTLARLERNPIGKSQWIASQGTLCQVVARFLGCHQFIFQRSGDRPAMTYGAYRILWSDTGKDTITVDLAWNTPRVAFVDLCSIAVEGQIYRLQPRIEYEGSDSMFEQNGLSVKYIPEAEWLSFNETDGKIRGTPPHGKCGWNTVVVKAIITHPIHEGIHFEQSIRVSVGILIMPYVVKEEPSQWDAPTAVDSLGSKVQIKFLPPENTDGVERLPAKELTLSDFGVHDDNRELPSGPKRTLEDLGSPMVEQLLKPVQASGLGCTTPGRISRVTAPKFQTHSGGDRNSSSTDQPKLRVRKLRPNGTERSSPRGPRHTRKALDILLGHPGEVNQPSHADPESCHDRAKVPVQLTGFGNPLPHVPASSDVSNFQLPTPLSSIPNSSDSSHTESELDDADETMSPIHLSQARQTLDSSPTYVLVNNGLVDFDDGCRSCILSGGPLHSVPTARTSIRGLSSGLSQASKTEDREIAIRTSSSGENGNTSTQEMVSFEEAMKTTTTAMKIAVEAAMAAAPRTGSEADEREIRETRKGVFNMVMRRFPRANIDRRSQVTASSDWGELFASTEEASSGSDHDDGEEDQVKQADKDDEDGGSD